VPLFFGSDGRPVEPSRGTGFTSRLPEGLRETASSMTRRLHAQVTGKLLDVEVTGAAYIPENRPVLVVSNHSSHVDSGVLRHALGKVGEDLPLLAAQDYFFGTPWKDLFFGDLLDLVPADRHGTGLGGVRQALRILESGRSLAIFPEGTRSRAGELQDFRPGAVLIALQAGVDILPVHIDGSHEVLPAGGGVPRSRSVRVRIGRPIAHTLLEQRVRHEGLSMQDAADLLRDSLVSLAGGGDTLDPWTRSLGIVGGGA
jgi:1-acyl-sn-glycerol-3-phosphate acyltransferase